MDKKNAAHLSVHHDNKCNFLIKNISSNWTIFFLFISGQLGLTLFRIEEE